MRWNVGALFLVAAALLIAPGILTDIVGFALLIPPLRALVKRGVSTWLRRHVQVASPVQLTYPTAQRATTKLSKPTSSAPASKMRR